MKTKSAMLAATVMFSFAAGMLFGQQTDDKKTPPKTSPPRVVVPPRNDREKPKDGGSNSNQDRNTRPRES